MQTFLPYPDYTSSAQCLDDKRLGKQRVEAYQILRALLTGRGWVHHPATLMWRGWEGSLAQYHDTCIRVWTSRGYDNNMPRLWDGTAVEQPRWLGRAVFHLSHQSNLKRKLPSHYTWDVPDNLPYYWNYWFREPVSNWDGVITNRLEVRDGD